MSEYKVTFNVGRSYSICYHVVEATRALAIQTARSWAVQETGTHNLQLKKVVGPSK